MRLFTIPLLMAATAGLTHAQCEGFAEDFETLPLGQQINLLPTWVGNNNAVVGAGTGSNFSQVLRLDPAGGFSSTAARSVPSNVSTAFTFECELKAVETCELRIICGQGGPSTIGGLRISSFNGTVESFATAGQTLPLSADFATVRITAESGGDITIFYDGQFLDQHPWPSTCQSVSFIQFAAIGFQGTPSVLEADELCMGELELGTVYCSSNPNSTGATTSMVATGSAAVASNDVTLRMASMPTNATGYFITSRTQGFVANPAGSQGNLCLGGSIGRYVGPGQVGNSGGSGQISLQIDLTAIPQANGAVAAVAGDTWNFQGWHRDVVGGQATSNFSDGLAVTFQ